MAIYHADAVPQSVILLTSCSAAHLGSPWDLEGSPALAQVGRSWSSFRGAWFSCNYSSYISAKTERAGKANAGCENLQMPTWKWMEMLPAYRTQAGSQGWCIIMNALVKKNNYSWKRLYENRVISDRSIGKNILEEIEWICFLLYCF